MRRHCRRRVKRASGPEDDKQLTDGGGVEAEDERLMEAPVVVDALLEGSELVVEVRLSLLKHLLLIAKHVLGRAQLMLLDS